MINDFKENIGPVLVAFIFLVLTGFFSAKYNLFNIIKSIYFFVIE